MTEIRDWGRVLVVYVDGYGGADAMREAMLAAKRDGYSPRRALRAHLIEKSPDPESFPSLFEVFVSAEEDQ